MSHPYHRVASLILTERKRQCITRGRLSQMIGDQNMSKGGHRIFKLEFREKYDTNLAAKLCAALGIDETVFLQSEADDHREYLDKWNRWADEPVRPYLVIRIIACLYCDRRIPEEITTQEAAEEFAASVARERKMKVCLVFSRRLSCWFDERGELSERTWATPFGGPNEPYATVCGRSFRLPNEPSIG